MALHRIKDFDPDYRNHFNDCDILKFDVYSGSEKVGSIDDLLVDDSGQFRYLVVNTGAWIVGKKVLLPIGQSRIDESAHRVYVDGLTRDQVKSLPAYNGEPVDYDYEERVRGVYRPTAVNRGTTIASGAYDRNSYRYDRDPALYNLNERNHSHLRRSEARLMSGRPIVGQHRRAVGVFPNRQSAEQALHELRDSGFPMARVSVVTRDADQHDQIAGADVRDRVGNKAEEGAAIGAVSGGALGGLTGLLVGLGVLAIPGVGPIMLAGATATALATTLAGGAIGAVSGGLLGALIGLGIPEDRARVYQERIAWGDYLVIVDGTDADIARAEAILHHRGIEEYGIYDAPSATPTASPATIHETRTTPVSRRSAVGFFSNLTDAEGAIADLRRSGFPLGQITLVGNNLQRREHFAGVNLHDRFDAARLEIPKEQARSYQERLGRGEYLVIVHGTEDELNRAAPLLNRHGVQQWRIIQPPVVYYELPLEAPRIRRAVAAPVTPTSSVSRVDQSHYEVRFFSHRRDAEQAIADLRNAGFPLGQISLVAQRIERREPFTDIDLQDRFDNSRFGFPEEQVRLFNNRIARGDYLLVVYGTPEQLQQAEAILNRAGTEEHAVHDASTIQPSMGVHNAPNPVPAASSSTIHETRTTLVGRRSATGFFPNLSDAEQAVTDLRSIGFPLSQITLVARDLQQRERFAGVDLRDRFEATRLGIPVEQTRLYNDRIGRGEYMVVVHGTEDELRRAASILNRHGIQDWRLYNSTGASTTPPLPEQAHHHAIGFFPLIQEAEQAIADLRSARFPLSQVSLVGSGLERREPFAGVNLLDHLDNTRFGLPEERYRSFHHRLALGNYLLVIHGSREQLWQAEAILTRPRIHDFGIYDAPGITSAHPDYEQVNRIRVPVASTPVITSSAANRVGQRKRAIGVFSHRRDVEAALTELRNAGFPMALISLIGKQAGDHDRIAGVVAGGSTGAVVELGIPADRVRVYNDRVARGDYLVMIEGTEAQTRQAESVLRRHDIHEWGIYDAADVDSTRRAHESVERYTEPDVDSTHRNREPRIDRSHPFVTIIDRRDEPQL